MPHLESKTKLIMTASVNRDITPKKMKKNENHVQFFSHFRYNRGVGAKL